METTLYIIRHGSTPANTSGLYHGVTDTPLLPLGEEQALKLRERFHHVHLDAVYASPLQRARRTATPMAEDHGLPVIVVPELIEMNGGAIEDVSMEENARRYPELVENMKHHLPLVACPNGETMREVFDRMTATVDRLARENLGRTIAIVSHGAVLQSIWCHLQGRPFEALERHMVHNTAVSKAVYHSDGGYTPEYIGDISHLPDELQFQPFEADGQRKLTLEKQ